MIEVSRVSKVYASPAGPVSVLQDLDLTVAPSETVAIVGPSGSGKTTLLNLLGAIDRPTSGSITMDGVDLGGLDADAAARFRNRTIGFIFQLHHLLPQCTILENVLVPRLAGGWDEDAAAVRARARPVCSNRSVSLIASRIAPGSFPAANNFASRSPGL
jgi:lipoprotein-releasing system ATP-binding protein